MAQKRALIISTAFPPSIGSGVWRIRGFVKYLPRFGWEPYVLTRVPSPYHAPGAITGPTEIPGAVQVTRMPFADIRLLGKKLLLQVSGKGGVGVSYGGRPGTATRQGGEKTVVVSGAHVAFRPGYGYRVASSRRTARAFHDTQVWHSRNILVGTPAHTAPRCTPAEEPGAKTVGRRFQRSVDATPRPMVLTVADCAEAGG